MRENKDIILAGTFFRYRILEINYIFVRLSQIDAADNKKAIVVN